MRRSVALLMGILALSVSVHSSLAQTIAPTAQPHQTVSYQGLLQAADGKAITDGDYQITMRLYSDQDGTQEVWHDTYLAHVSNGVFNVLLGSGAEPLPAASAMDRGLWLGIQVGATNELRPL